MAQAKKLAYTPRDTATAQTLPRATQIRNVKKVDRKRINNDFAYLQQAALAQNASNDEIFNANYQKQGLQPSTREVRPKQEPAANDEEWTEFDNEQALAEEDFQIRSRIALGQQEENKKAAMRIKKIRGMTRATAVNVSVFAWATPLWLAVQIPAAIFSVIAFAISGVVNSFLSSSNILVSAAAWVADKALAGAGALFGLDVNLIKMADGLFLITYVFVLAIGIFSLLAIYLQYTMAHLRPLSGEASGLKIGMLLLAVAGYGFPVLNLFPWALLWMAAVWKYPK